VKLFAREHARTMGIPVVMDTSDRGLVDVERFDLEPDRPLLHGLIEDLPPVPEGRPMTNEEKLPYLAQMVGMDTLSYRMKASLPELGKTITTWPQLASGVVLGGGVVGDVVRRTLTGTMTWSGRWWVDVETATEIERSASFITNTEIR